MKLDYLFCCRAGFTNNLIKVPYILESAEVAISVSFNSIDEGSDFIEIALCVDLVVDECGDEAIALIDVFDGFALWA